MSIGRFEKVSLEQFNFDLKQCLNIDGTKDIYDDIILPKRATKGSAGYDFVCPINLTIKQGEMLKIPSGIRCYIEDSYVLNIYPRSSLGFKYQMMLANTTGIIDSDYYGAKNEGHIIIALVNKGDKDIILKKGDRFVQGIFFKFYTVDEEEIETKRIGGFGSSN